jgi:hypothetical protein
MNLAQPDAIDRGGLHPCRPSGQHIHHGRQGRRFWLAEHLNLFCRGVPEFIRPGVIELVAWRGFVSDPPMEGQTALGLLSRLASYDPRMSGGTRRPTVKVPRMPACLWEQQSCTRSVHGS